MVESAAHKTPVVDLDEFERRLRGPAAPTRDHSDPLAELARLVDGDSHSAGPRPDPFAFRPEAPRAAPVVRLPTAAWDREEPKFDLSEAPPALRPTHEPHPQDALTLQETFEREMAQLHTASGSEPNSHAMSAPANDEHGQSGRHGLAAADQATPEHYEPHGAQDSAAAPQSWVDNASDAPQKPKRTNRPFYIMGAISVVALALIGGSFAMRAGASGSAKNTPTIKAADTPVKIAAAQDGADAPKGASILDKPNGNSENVSGSKVVASAEQPVDLNQAVSKLPSAGNAPTRSITTAIAPPAPDIGPATGSSSDPKAQVGNSANSLFGAPKRVKTVAVKPDGSLVADQSAAPAAAQEAPAVPVPRPQIAGLPVTAPSVAPATPKPAAPKATVRVVPVAKPAAKPAPKPEADTGDATGATAPLQLPSASSRPKIARATPPAAENDTPAVAASGGKFAVQLAAPPTEQEAKETATRLQRQFSAELGGRQPSIRQASANGRDVYRVRINSLSREEAKAMCDRLVAAGGKCYVAQN